MARAAQAASGASASGDASAAETGEGLPAAASTAPRHPSGHTFDETGGRCLTCHWEFRTVQVPTSRRTVDPDTGIARGVDSSIANHQYRQGPDDTWMPVWQDPTLPARWPRCPSPAPDETVEDLES